MQITMTPLSIEFMQNQQIYLRSICIFLFSINIGQYIHSFYYQDHSNKEFCKRNQTSEMKSSLNESSGYLSDYILATWSLWQAGPLCIVNPANVLLETCV